MGNYVEVSNIKDFKVNGVPVCSDAYTDNEIEETITLAERFVENLTNDIFYPLEATYKFDGCGLEKQFFVPEIQYRLLTVASVKEYDVNGTSVLHTYTEGIDYVRYPFYIETSRWYPNDSPRHPIGPGGTWPRGQKNIWIEGTWGNTECPPEIKRAVILLVLERLHPGSTGMSPTGINKAVWDDFSVEFTTSKNDINGSGYADVDLLIQNYINYNGMFIVVPDKRQTYDGGNIRLV